MPHINPSAMISNASSNPRYHRIVSVLPESPETESPEIVHENRINMTRESFIQFRKILKEQHINYHTICKGKITRVNLSKDKDPMRFYGYCSFCILRLSSVPEMVTHLSSNDHKQQLRNFMHHKTHIGG